MHRLALLLTYLLPAPVMLLAANRMSTGVGVRPREGRIEVTVDFTPDEDLMTSVAAFLAAVIPAVANWPDHGLGQLAARRLPVSTIRHSRCSSSSAGSMIANLAT